MRNLLSGLLVAAITLALCFGAAEALVRLTQSSGENFDIEMWRYARDLKQVSPIEGAGHEHVPNRAGTYMGVPVAINEAGWRDGPHPVQKPEGTLRIMMLGDSITFGWGAPPDGITANILEARLNGGSAAAPVEVLNTGIGNTNTAMQVARFLGRGVRYKPDIVVLNYFINDAEPTPARKTHWLFEWSYAAVFFAGRLDIVMRSFFGRESWLDYYRNLYGEDRPGWKATREALARLAAYCRENSIALMVAHYPELHRLDPYPFAEVTSKVRAEAERLDVPFVDLTGAVKDLEPRSLWVTSTDAHPNKTAAERFAAVIDEALKANFGGRFVNAAGEQ